MSKRILVSLGGNALGTDFDELIHTVGVIAEPIAQLVQDGYEVVVCHGNGPQVGMIKTAIDTGKMEADQPTMPLSEAVAMSQSYIGYHLQNAIQNACLKKYGSEPKVATVISRCVVDPKDPRFQNPTKPIGAFLSKEQADELNAQGIPTVEDSGRGYRQVVASPLPKRIVEEASVLDLINAGNIVIAGGGGGIPVTFKDNWYKAIDAVIDKDWVSVMLANACHVDELVILTGVEKVAVGFGTPDQKWLDQITLADCEKYIEAGEFPEGSMLPKVRAAMQFVEADPKHKTLITSLDKLVEGLRGETGTWIVS